MTVGGRRSVLFLNKIRPHFSTSASSKTGTRRPLKLLMMWRTCYVSRDPTDCTTVGTTRVDLPFSKRGHLTVDWQVHLTIACGTLKAPLCLSGVCFTSDCHVSKSTMSSLFTNSREQIQFFSLQKRGRSQVLPPPHGICWEQVARS